MLLGFATLFSPTNWRIEIFNFLQPKYYTIMLEPLLCDVIYKVRDSVRESPQMEL